MKHAGKIQARNQLAELEDAEGFLLRRVVQTPEAGNSGAPQSSG